MKFGVCVFRLQCAKHRKKGDDVDAYTHTRPGETNLTPAVYDSVTIETPRGEPESDDYTHTRQGEINLTPGVYETITTTPTYETIREA